MPHKTAEQKITGTLKQILFSPKGSIEGLLLGVGSKIHQVRIKHPPDAEEAKALDKAVRKSVELKATLDESHKTKDGAHPVYELRAITKIAGRSVTLGAAERHICGVVAAIHFAKHGEPNGVILKTGEFIHTRPPGMKKLRLVVGSEVIVQGETRTTVLGTPLIEARVVNQVALD